MLNRNERFNSYRSDRVFEGFPGSRDRMPTGEKEYEPKVNPTHIRLLKKALEKCEMKRVPRGVDRSTSYYGSRSGSIVDLYTWPEHYNIFGENVRATIELFREGYASIEISASRTFPKSLSKMLKECGFQVTVSDVSVQNGKGHDHGSYYDKDDLESAPFDSVLMYNVKFRDAAVMFGKLAEHLPKARAQFTKDTRTPDGHAKTERDYDIEHGLISERNYNVIVKCSAGADVISKICEDNAFECVVNTFDLALENFGISDAFLKFMNTTLPEESISSYDDTVVAAYDFIEANVNVHHLMDQTAISQDTVDALKVLLRALVDIDMLPADVKVSIEETDMNAARTKRVAKNPQASLHFESVRRAFAGRRNLREAKNTLAYWLRRK